MTQPITPEKAKLRLASLCARSEQCTHDLMEKCLRWGLSPADAREVVRNLMENRFVDDLRFARAFANDKFKYAGWGPMKIRQALALKRIHSEYVGAALASIEEDEEAMKAAVRNAAKGKMRSLDISDPADRQKLYRFLASRGFSLSLITKALKDT